MIAVVALLALQAKAPLKMKAVFIEACTCKATCEFEVSGKLPGCRAMGAYSIHQGTFAGKDISGVKVAFVVAPNNQLFLYADCPPSQTDIAKRLVFTLFGEFGDSQGLQAAKISIAKTDKKPGHYSLKIGGGQIASLRIEPLFGGDGKTPVVLRNVFGDPYDSLSQARVIDASFNKAGHNFSMKQTNAYYIADLKVDKRI